MLGLDKVRALVAGRVPDDQLEERAAALLEAAVAQAPRRWPGRHRADGRHRCRPNASRYVRVAHSFRRPRHIILLETARGQRRRRGRAGAQRAAPRDSTPARSATRASRPRCGSAARRSRRLKRIVFRPAPETTTDLTSAGIRLAASSVAGVRLHTSLRASLPARGAC